MIASESAEGGKRAYDLTEAGKKTVADEQEAITRIRKRAEDDEWTGWRDAMHGEAAEIMRPAFRLMRTAVKSGLDDVVDVRLGDAKEIVEKLDVPIDLALIDAWESDYPFYFDALLPKLRVGGCIVADNITYPESAQDSAKAYQAHVRAQSNVRSQLLSIGSGLEMSVKTA